MDFPPTLVRSSTVSDKEPEEEPESHINEGFFSSIYDVSSPYFIDASTEFVETEAEFVQAEFVQAEFQNVLEPLDMPELLKESAPLQVVIVCVVDRSGSMQHSLPQLMRTLEEVMQDQHAQYPDAEVYLTDFNSKVFQHPVKPIKSIVEHGFPLLTAEGTTAYHDAAHGTILNILQKYSNEVKKVFITLTDGEDNASSVSKRSVFDLIKYAEQRNSAFIYLGSSKEILMHGDDLGIKTQIEFDQLNVNIPQLRRGITNEVCRGIHLSQNTAD